MKSSNSPVDSGSTLKEYKTLDEAIEVWLYLMRRQLTGMPEIHKTEILKWCELSFSAGWLENEILGRAGDNRNPAPTDEQDQ